jgi:hypothetical protein
MPQTSAEIEFGQLELEMGAATIISKSGCYYVKSFFP